jgi:tetratricopeptide (TPR) repeat protein
MAFKAFKTANTLIAAGRLKKAAGAYIEAIEYPADALDKWDRSIAFNNLPACLSQGSRMEEAMRYARQFCQEFTGNPCAFFTLATTIVHQQALSGEINDEIAECIEKADSLLSRALGNEPWLVDISLEDMRACVLDWKEYLHIPQNGGPAAKAAQSAIDEYNKDDGDIVKAAHAIDEALKLELNHPDRLRLRAIRGSIYLRWG